MARQSWNMVTLFQSVFPFLKNILVLRNAPDLANKPASSWIPVIIRVKPQRIITFDYSKVFGLKLRSWGWSDAACVMPSHKLHQHSKGALIGLPCFSDARKQDFSGQADRALVWRHADLGLCLTVPAGFCRLRPSWGYYPYRYAASNR